MRAQSPKPMSVEHKLQAFLTGDTRSSLLLADDIRREWPEQEDARKKIFDTLFEHLNQVRAYIPL